MSRQLNPLRGDIPLPAAVIRESALAHNIAVMSAWTREHGFELAPHGKTTMCPKIFRRQLDAGAWGITAATSTQASVCLAAGARRVLIANQLIARGNIRELRSAVDEFPDTELYCLVDSEEGLRVLDEQWQGAQVPMRILLEYGRDGWRTGVRSCSALQALHDKLLTTGPHLRFAGLEAFEGLAADPEQAEHFLHTMIGISREFLAANDRLIFSAGGSAYLGVLERTLRSLPPGWTPVLRSGCYVTHDHGIYEKRQAESAGMDIPHFQAALELWSIVQSRPEPNVAILNFGKRNASYDLGLPVPLDLPGCRITALNDQHGFMTVPDGVQVQIGDLIRLGISHPCTTFDKWRKLLLVDDEYNVLDTYETFF